MRLVIISGLALLFVVLATGQAQAVHATTTVSCSGAHAYSGTTGHVDAYVIWNQNAPTPITNGKCDVSTAAVTDANYAGYDLPSGSTVTYECLLLTGGTLPPQVPTSIVISAYSDNANQGGGGTPVWTQTFATCGSTANATTFTEKLTATGAGSTAKAGTLRLFVEIVDTNTGQTYDCNSDDAGTQTAPTGGTCNTGAVSAETGVGRGDPGFSAPNLTASGVCPCLTYEGGDSLVGSLTASASEYSSGARLTMSIQDGAGPFATMGTAYAITNAPQTESVTIQGPFSTWPSSGALSMTFAESGSSTIPGFTGLSYWVFTAQNLAGGLALQNVNHVTWSTGDSVSRVGSQSGTCGTTVAGSATTIVQRGEIAHVAGCAPWRDPRGQNVPNNQKAQVWIQRSGTFETYADFQGFNGTFGAGADLPSDNFAQDAGAGCVGANPGSNSCATTTVGLAYDKMVETCAAVCTANEGNLWNVANSSGVLDVSSTYASNVYACKLSPCSLAGNITGAFIIGSDQEFGIVTGVLDGAGNGVASVNVTCQETEPDHTTTLSPVSMGSTSGTGSTGTTLLEAVTLGPTGTWVLACTGAMNGNAFTYTISYFHTSPVTAQTSIVLDYNWLPNNTVSFQVGFRTVGNNGTSIVSEFPDNSSDVRICLHYAETIGRPYHGCSPVLMTQNGNLAVWTANLTAPDPGNLCFIHAHAWANLTGILFLASQNLQFRPPGAFSAAMNGGGTCTFTANATGTSNLTNGNFSGNFTGNVTFSDASGMITSVLDPYLPLLIWGSLLVLFLWFNAWLPAVVVLMDFANDVLPQGRVWPLAGSFLFLFIAISIHSMVVNGLIPRPFVRDEKKR